MNFGYSLQTLIGILFRLNKIIQFRLRVSTVILWLEWKSAISRLRVEVNEQEMLNKKHAVLQKKKDLHDTIKHAHSWDYGSECWTQPWGNWSQILYDKQLSQTFEEIFFLALLSEATALHHRYFYPHSHKCIATFIFMSREKMTPLAIKKVLFLVKRSHIEFRKKPEQ